MAVIERTGRGVCVCGVIVSLLVVFRAGSADPEGCDAVRTSLQRVLKGQPGRLLDKPDAGELCDVSCCSREVEKELYKTTQLALNHYIKNSISKISSILETRARKFDECFRGMMNTSKLEFHEMFEKTYGKIYLKNADVFSDFFGELETYYRRGTVRLSETMDTFFGILYQRMFTVINAQYTFDEKYLECVSEHMAEMKPFGDVPKKLGIQLRRSFVATRTFYKSLMKSVDVAEKLASLSVDAECYKETARMRFCGFCKGENDSVPCADYCTSTMQGCLRHHMELSSHWDNLIDAIDKVGERLLGPYNIEQVVDPLNIKISEAIMNFQESGAEVSKKIYSKCGKPPLSRPKRKADYTNVPEDNLNTEIDTKPVKPNRKKHKKVTDTVDTKSTLEKIIIDLKQKIKETKQFWMQLPYQYCNNLSIFYNYTETENCWNGTGTDSMNPTRTGIGESAIVNEQIYIVQGLTEKLRKAHQGQEVEMVDDTEESLAGSGSGSGDSPIEEEEEEQNPYGKDIVFKEDEEIDKDLFTTVPPPSSTKPPEVVRTTSKASRTTDMSLTRALIQYLLPMVLVWFGGAITNLL